MSQPYIDPTALWSPNRAHRNVGVHSAAVAAQRAALLCLKRTIDEQLQAPRYGCWMTQRRPSSAAWRVVQLQAYAANSTTPALLMRLALAPAGGAAAPGGATAPGGAAAARSGAEGSMSMLGAQRLLLSLESRKSLCVAAITHWPRHAHTQICSCIIFPFICPALSLLGGFGREASL